MGKNNTRLRTRYSCWIISMSIIIMFTLLLMEMSHYKHTICNEPMIIFTVKWKTYNKNVFENIDDTKDYIINMYNDLWPGIQGVIQCILTAVRWVMKYVR